MTSYTITPGYSSGATQAQLDAAFRATFDSLKNATVQIVTEAQRVSTRLTRSDLLSCAEKMSEGKDLSLRLRLDEDGRPMVLMYASGGGSFRRAKEETRRAFCRLFMEAMHRLDMEVNIHVC